MGNTSLLMRILFSVFQISFCILLIVYSRGVYCKLTDDYTKSSDRSTGATDVNIKLPESQLNTGKDDNEDDGSVDADSKESLNSVDEEANRLYDEAMTLVNRTYARASAKKLARRLLLQAADRGHVAAREKLAFAALTGQGSEQSISTALSSFKALAADGNPHGQLGLGIMYAAGLGGLNASVAHALIYLTFSALGEEPLAQMAMGYRYWSGIGVESNCETALTYYRKVAKTVANVVRERSQSGGPTLLGPTVHRVRLQDESDAAFSFINDMSSLLTDLAHQLFIKDIYNSSSDKSEKLHDGDGASSETDESVVEAIGGSSVGSTHFISEDLLQYYQLMAEKQNVSAQVFLGQLYYHGSHGVEMNHKRAYAYFYRAAEEGSSLAMAFLGEMLISGGEAVPMNAERGLEYLRQSSDGNNPIGQTLLGIAYLRGRAGLDKDPIKALDLFLKAADQGWADAQLNLGLLFLGTLGMRTDYKLALKYLNLASQQGNTLAFFHLGEMHATGVGVLRSCTTATELYKNVAERGRWSQYLMSALSAFRAGRFNEAFVTYQVLAELGYEVAQANAAFLLEQGIVEIVPRSEHHKRALLLLQRSASQGSTASRVRLGDYHYYGMGTKQDFSMAIQHYRVASELQRNPQAMFNLAYMHEQGLGLQRDIHLAKRFYDMAIETSKDAYYPVRLALTRLQLYFLAEYMRDIFWPYVQSWFGTKQVKTPSDKSAGISGNMQANEDEHSTKNDSIDWDYYFIPLLAGLLIALIFFLKARRNV